MQRTRTIAVAGATGRLGRHIVDVLEAQGHDVVSISRSTGVDVITGEGLAEALSGVEYVIDAATQPTPDQDAATEFFTTAARNIQEAGERAGVRRIVVVSIVGTDRFSGGFLKAKFAHEQAMRAGSIPVQILRATQFHEFVQQMVEWGTQGDVVYVPKTRTQLVAARSVAEALADMVNGADDAQQSNGAIPEIGGPRAETLAEMVKLLNSQRGEPLQVEEVTNPADPDHELLEHGALLPGPHATLTGPTFDEWLRTHG
ncbi:MAG: SDR family oxidoreductase [Gaiellales bacterium]